MGALLDVRGFFDRRLSGLRDNALSNVKEKRNQGYYISLLSSFPKSCPFLGVPIPRISG